jgi:hypothetical protein
MIIFFDFSLFKREELLLSRLLSWIDYLFEWKDLEELDLFDLLFSSEFIILPLFLRRREDWSIVVPDIDGVEITARRSLFYIT